MNISSRCGHAARGPASFLFGTDHLGRDIFTRVKQVLSVREFDYVLGARALGANDVVIMLRYVLPNVMAPIIEFATLGVGTAILAAAALGYLGLGAQPPTPEWGAMLARSRDFVRFAWWMTTFPGLAIMVTVIAMNLVGDGLRDVLDPRVGTR